MSTSSIPSFIKIHQAVLEKKLKMWKVYARRTDGRTDGRTDDGRCAMTIAHSSLWLRWAKKTKNKCNMGREPTWKPPNASNSLFSTNSKRSETHLFHVIGLNLIFQFPETQFTCVLIYPFPNVIWHSGTWPYEVASSTDQTLHEFLNLFPNWTFLPILILLPNFERFPWWNIATGAASQQRTLAPPDTWSCLTLGLAFVLMLGPFFPELFMSTDLLSFDYPSVLRILFCYTRYVNFIDV